MYGRLHVDICNVSQLLINGVKLQIKLTNANPAFYLLSKKEDSKVYFKVLKALLYVKRFRPSAAVITAHNETLLEGYPIRYNLKIIELKTFTFADDSQSLSMDNAVLGRLPKRLIVTMIKNTDFFGSMFSNPFNFRHYDLTHFAMFVNGKQVPPEDLTLDMSREETAIMGYRTLFERSCIYHSNSGLQVTPAKCINGYFTLVFDLTPDLAASEGHISDRAHGNIRLELKFGEALPDPLVCLLYLEFNNSVSIDAMRQVSKDF